MAKNYTFSEAVNIIAEGKDLESIADIGRRYPVLATKVAVVAAKAGDAFTDLMSFMPDYLTANKVNAAIKNSITGSGTTEDEDADDENETVEDAGEDTETTVQWNESMSAKQLWDLLGKAGKRKAAKSTKKADLIEACKKVFGDAGKNVEDTEEDTSEDEETNPYEGKSAMELFKECKARKIKAAPKKPAKFYVDLLLKDDEAKAEATEDEEDDDWGDEEEAEAPKKEEKKASKGGKPKAEKKAEAESDDDDDWDI